MSSDVAAARSAPVWRPVRGGNAFEITVARPARAIKLGLVAEGDRLRRADLAERLQVSRVTLREAIRALREAGYLSRAGADRRNRPSCRRPVRGREPDPPKARTGGAWSGHSGNGPTARSS
jgi:hypothetical protein